MKFVHHHFETLPSTNDWAKKELPSFDKQALTIITSHAQTQGRGRYGRFWHSPTGVNLYTSFCFFLNKDQSDPLILTHVMALSISKLLEEEGLDCQIKWPNDILVSGKKIAGILCETVPFKDQFGIVLGLGLNINLDQKSLELINQPATSIFYEMGKTFSIEEILTKLKHHFQEDLALFLDKGFDPLLPAFHKRLIPKSSD
ncbi:MAG: Bifunctional ligase/repressor BirA [Chlamydiales bacterium]|nr:Bifunctional ligase/repressor BirA [Chlamydiales bacterium]MCH9619424.1 Bifunctional ligase/repressor BirA [Chlamydiales bacterium]MCH9622228.1 Bifunctional ligase/repressor BirA [Chlamydiales bacterium]